MRLLYNYFKIKGKKKSQTKMIRFYVFVCLFDEECFVWFTVEKFSWAAFDDCTI